MLKDIQALQDCPEFHRFLDRVQNDPKLAFALMLAVERMASKELQSLLKGNQDGNQKIETTQA